MLVLRPSRDVVQRGRAVPENVGDGVSRTGSAMGHHRRRGLYTKTGAREACRITGAGLGSPGRGRQTPWPTRLDPPFADASVAAIYAAYPPALRARLLDLRRLIFDTAEVTPGVGAIVETLKWGPAQLPDAVRQRQHDPASTRSSGMMRAMPCSSIARPIWWRRTARSIPMSSASRAPAASCSSAMRPCPARRLAIASHWR